MKNLLYFFISLVSLNAYSQSDALTYMEKIQSNDQEILKQTWDYLSIVARQKSAKKIESKRQNIENIIRNSINTVKLLPGFNGYTAYRDSSMVNLNFHLDLMTGKAQKLVDMEEISSKSYDSMEAYILYQRQLNKLSDKKTEMIQAEQRKFAQKNNITLIESESELSKKVKKGSAILQYKEDLFLVFARCSMYENELIEILGKAEESYDYRAAGLVLSNLVDHSQSVLDTIKPINTDNSLKNQTKKALEFYQEEALKLVPEFANHTKLNNEFKAFQKEYDALPKEQITNEKVAEYNKKVKEINLSSNKLNQLSNLFNNKRSQNTNLWNQTAENFVERHMPR